MYRNTRGVYYPPLFRVRFDTIHGEDHRLIRAPTKTEAKTRAEHAWPHAKNIVVERPV